MHHTELPGWVGRDTLALFAQEMGLTVDEANRAEWTDTEDFIKPRSKDVDWQKITVGNWWVTVDLKAYLFWAGFTDPDDHNSDTYLWEQVCQGCCGTRDSFSTRDVEVPDGRVVELPLCDKVCAPDFWDDIEPSEWTTLDQAFLPDDREKPKVRLEYWMCEHCSSMCPHGMMALMQDNDYDPPTKTLVCSNCQKREPDRFVAA